MNNQLNLNLVLISSVILSATNAQAVPTPMESKVVAAFRATVDCEINKTNDQGQDVPLSDDEVLAQTTIIPVSGKDYSGATISSTLYQVLCTGGAYNVDYVFFAPVGDQVVAISFAQPEWQTDAKTHLTRLTGMSATTHLTNVGMDAKTGKLESYAKFRGMGDAFSDFTYMLDYTGEVIRSRLVKAVVDDLEDEKIKPVTLFQIK